MIERNTFKPAPWRKSKLADRGKTAEKAVQSYLEAWESRSPHREFSRLVDSKAAGRTIKAAAADFEFFCLDMGISFNGLIEVKETEHEYRLDRKRLTQSPKLRKRAKCGGLVFVLIYHSTIKKWRCLPPEMVLDPSTKGSWDLRGVAAYDSPGACLYGNDIMWERIDG